MLAPLDADPAMARHHRLLERAGGRAGAEPPERRYPLARADRLG